MVDLIEKGFKLFKDMDSFNQVSDLLTRLPKSPAAGA